jgi:hypothetical protein
MLERTAAGELIEENVVGLMNNEDYLGCWIGQQQGGRRSYMCPLDFNVI